MTKPKVLKAQCIHCGKTMYSMYKGQLDSNLNSHENTCPLKTKGEKGGAKSPVPSSVNLEEGSD